MLRIYSGDARVWMSVATDLYERNLVFPINIDESPCANELNVANVCAGYAFELAYKALVEVTKQTPKSTHRLRDAHARLDEDVRIEIERIIAEHGWNDIDSFLDHFDKELRHEERRYWMRPKNPSTNEGPANQRFWYGYRVGIDFLAKLHNDLLDFAESLIDRDTDHESY